MKKKVHVDLSDLPRYEKVSVLYAGFMRPSYRFYPERQTNLETKTY